MAGWKFPLIEGIGAGLAELGLRSDDARLFVEPFLEREQHWLAGLAAQPQAMFDHRFVFRLFPFRQFLDRIDRDALARW